MIVLHDPSLPTPGGAWVAYYPDTSGTPVLFALELDALRYAIGTSMLVRFAAYGSDDWMHGDPVKPQAATVPRSAWRYGA